MRSMLAKFKPKAFLVIFTIVLVVAPSAALAVHNFSDVPDSHTFHNDIQWMFDNGMTSGCGSGNYCPQDDVTRGEMAAFMKRLATQAVVEAGSVSGDIVMTHDGSGWKLWGGGSAPTTFENWATYTNTSTDGGESGVIMALNGPVSIGGVEYGLSKIEFCTDTTTGAPEVRFHTVFTSDGELANDWDSPYWEDEVVTDGCTVIEVSSPVGAGATLAIKFIAGGVGDEITLGSVKTTWTTAAAVVVEILSTSGSANNR